MYGDFGWLKVDGSDLLFNPELSIRALKGDSLFAKTLGNRLGQACEVTLLTKPTEYLAPLLYGFRIRIVANDANRTQRRPVTEQLLFTGRKAVIQRLNVGSYQDS